MKKLLIVGSGMLSGLIFLLFVVPFLSGLSVSLFTGETVSYSISGIRLVADYNFLSGYQIILVSLLTIAPIIFSVAAIEISMILINNSKLNKIKSPLIVFQLVNVGFLIFTIFLGLLSMILQSKIETLWNDLMRYLQVSETEKLLIMFVFLFIVFIYINLTSRRMRYLIPSVKQK